jgi:hypothetical protein
MAAERYRPAMSYNSADFWSPTLEADLDKLVPTLSQDPRFASLDAGVKDILAAQLVYFAGFKAIQDGAIGPEAVPAELRSWVHTVPSPKWRHWRWSGGLDALLGTRRLHR